MSDTVCERCNGSGYWDDAESKLDPQFNSVCDKDADACPRCSRFAGYDVRCSYRCPTCDGDGAARESCQLGRCTRNAAADNPREPRT